MEQSSHTLERIGKLGLIARVRGESQAASIGLATALIEGGVEAIEVSFTVPEAHWVMQDLRSEYGDRILLGAGTLRALDQAEQAVEAGAAFLSSPGCDSDFLTLMQQTGLTVIPGAFTPSEVMLARLLGAEAVQLFPEPPRGSSYLKSLHDAFPDTLFLPTEGVSLENVRHWFAAGAFAVGIGDALAPSTLRDNGGRDEAVARAQQFVETVREIISRAEL